MDLVGGAVAGVAAAKEAKDRKKVMKEEKVVRDKTLEMEEEKHRLFIEQGLEKGEKEKARQIIALETEELRKEKERIDLEKKKLEHEKLKSGLTDKDSQFIEAAKEGNIKMLTVLSKNIEELDLDYIKVAHDIAVNQGDTSVVMLTKLALAKKEKTEKKKNGKSNFSGNLSLKSHPSIPVEVEDNKEVLEPEEQFEVPKSGHDGDYTETIVKTMPDGSVMRTTMSSKSMTSGAVKSHTSRRDDFPSMKNRRGSRGFFENSLPMADKSLSSGFNNSFFDTKSWDFGGRLGKSRLSMDTMFSGMEDFTNMSNMMRNNSDKSSSYDMNNKSINK